MPYLPVALDPIPEVGEVVIGYGFAGLDVSRDSEGDDRPMTQYLYQSAGPVVEVTPADPASSMPWPRFRVAAEWPSGMSGGPVVNAEGNVVGVISRGWTGEADSTATHFAGWDISRRTFPTIDPSGVRCFRGFAAIDERGEVWFLGQDVQEAKAFAADRGMTVRTVSCSPETGEWLSL